MARRALVCDDDAPIRKMVRDILEGLGVEVVEASDGQQALSFLLREKFDLMVTDFLMPRIDGLQVIRDLRALPGGDRVPVVLMSAISRSQMGPEGRGPDHYINKPFKPRKMARLLESILARLPPA